MFAALLGSDSEGHGDDVVAPPVNPEGDGRGRARGRGRGRGRPRGRAAIGNNIGDAGGGRGRGDNAVGRGRGRGRAGGFHFDDAARARMSSARYRGMARRLENRNLPVVFQARVASAGFGPAPDCADKFVRSKNYFLDDVNLAIDSHHGHSSDCMRGCVSYMSAQGDQIAEFLKRPDTDAIIACNVYDDADMWVTPRPVENADGENRAPEQSDTRKKGSNITPTGAEPS